MAVGQAAGEGDQTVKDAASVPSAGLPPEWMDGLAAPWDTPQPGAENHGPAARLSAGGMCWVAAHGGAGATMLAAAVGGVDVGCRWPDARHDEPARVLLVARTHLTGLRAAARALNAVREGRHPAGMELVGLVLVADLPGRLPATLRKQIRRLGAGVPVLRIPWIPQWRIGKRPDRLPRRLTQLGDLVDAARGADTR